MVNEKPNWARTLRRRLRAAVHRRSKGKEAFWHDKPMTDSELEGRLSFLNMTQPEEAERLREQLIKSRDGEQ